MTPSSPPFAGEGPRGAGRPFLLAHAVLILCFAALVTAAVAALSYAQPATYTSVARVVVAPQLLPNGGAPPAPDMGTEKALATSGSVTAVAADTLHLSADDAVRGVDIAVPVDTHVLEFRASAATPEEAMVRAKAFSDAYVSVRDATADKDIPQRVEVITPASAPTSPSGPDHLLQIGVAVILGLALGTGIAALRDRWNHHVRGAGDLAALTAGPVLGVLPRPRLRGQERLVVSTHPRSRVAEAYRFLRASLLGATRPGEGMTIVVTCASPRDHEARDVVVANLAAAAAEARRSVVVVPAVADRATLDGLLSAPPELLEVSGLRLDQVDSAVPFLSQTHDVVIVQAAAVTASASTVDALRRADAALLVVDTALSDRRSVKRAHDLVRRSCDGPVWAVLTHPCRARSARRDAPGAVAPVRPVESGAVARVPGADAAPTEGRA